MKTMTIVRIAAALCLGAAALSASAVQRSFVASYGLDTNPCTLAAPCRGFQAAITAVDAGGEVVALDSAGYGAMTINKSVQVIVPPGVYAGITAATGNAVLVSGTGIKVVLRGLSLNGTGGLTGIRIIGTPTVHVESCVVNGFISFGIDMEATTGSLFIKDSIVRNIGPAGGGVFVRCTTPASPCEVSIERSRFEDNGNGVTASRNAKVAVKDSAATGHSGYGFGATSPIANVSAELYLESSVSANNGTGVQAGPITGVAEANVSVSNSLIAGNGTGLLTDTNGTMRVSNTTVTRNTTGLLRPAGSLLSRGNNTVAGNTSDGTFSATFAPE